MGSAQSPIVNRRDAEGSKLESGERSRASSPRALLSVSLHFRDAPISEIASEIFKAAGTSICISRSQYRLRVPLSRSLI